MGETWARRETAIDGCDVVIGFVVRTGGFGEGFQANSMAIAASQQDIVWG